MGSVKHCCLDCARRCNFCSKGSSHPSWLGPCRHLSGLEGLALEGYNEAETDATGYVHPEWCGECKSYYPLPEGWPFDACPVCEWVLGVQKAANSGDPDWPWVEAAQISAKEQLQLTA